MSRLRERLEFVLAGNDLTEQQAEQLLIDLARPDAPQALSSAMLSALRAKGETSEEIRGLARGMRKLARRPRPVEGRTLDIVGTGGDGSQSLNISTATALLVAACGEQVIKHGNRSISSRSGSADVLESLGVSLPLDEHECMDLLDHAGFTFLFAPYFHPAMGQLAGVRRELGVRTVFNLLGPLTNPAKPTHQLLGAYSIDAAQKMAHALAGTEVERAYVVHGDPGWDEPSTIGPFHLFDVQDGHVRHHRRDPIQEGFERCRPEDLAGGDIQTNASRLRSVLCGEERGPYRDTVVLGACLALELAGSESSLQSARDRVEAVIDDGDAQQFLDRLREGSRDLANSPRASHG